MTPHKEPLNAPQERSYNNCLKRECLIIERCFGQLKRRFPILQGRVRIHLNLVPSVDCCFLCAFNTKKRIKLTEKAVS